MKWGTFQHQDKSGERCRNDDPNHNGHQEIQQGQRDPGEHQDGMSPFLWRQRMLADVEPTEFFQGLSLLFTYQKRLQDIASGKSGKQITGVSAKRESVLPLPLSAYESQKKTLADGFWKAAKFLRKESFFSKRDLPYRTQIVPLATVLTLLGDRWLEQKVYDRICRWFWCGVLGELYGGAVETRMTNDLQELMAWIDGSDNEPSTARDANFQPGRLDTLRTRNSAAYKAINVLIQRNGAQDFFWKSTIRELDETDWEECKLDNISTTCTWFLVIHSSVSSLLFHANVVPRSCDEPCSFSNALLSNGSNSEELVHCLVLKITAEVNLAGLARFANEPRHPNRTVSRRGTPVVRLAVTRGSTPSIDLPHSDQHHPRLRVLPPSDLEAGSRKTGTWLQENEC